MNTSLPINNKTVALEVNLVNEVNFGSGIWSGLEPF